jgi:predicted DNA-binding transcriptional regulator AlpA
MAARTAVKVRHLTTEELAERLGFSVRTVEGWRRTGYGPRWLPGKGSAGVRYREADIEAWEESRLKGAVPEPQPATA